MEIYNSLSRKKETFEPLHEGRAGIYVCGPTVYGDPHLGHARSAITFDILARYFRHKGYKVRYVRNITDVGHLENDADAGEDKIAKKARLEALEPMEVAQYYTNRYHDCMRLLNVLPPSIEPHASGHIIEQIEMVKKIIAHGFAYETNGSVYFDVEKYNHTHAYGKLSGRILDDMQTSARDLDGQRDKRHPADFALWKKAAPEHIMRWASPWSDGFPGWHLECSAMSTKYLGEQFDIHGGGLDLIFPHHECEIAQSVAAQGCEAARYWMHNNMITLNGQKMGKSLGNFITLDEMFAGSHNLLAQAYSPMTVRFFMLQAHYRSPLDFSNEALQAAEKGMKRLFEAIQTLHKITPAGGGEDPTVEGFIQKTYAALDDDLNTPIAVAHLFDAVRFVNAVNDGKDTLTATGKAKLQQLFDGVLTDTLGIASEQQQTGNTAILHGLMNMTLEARNLAKANKDWAASDKIRQQLSDLGITVKDTKDGTVWSLE
ncbi:MAG: cysteine--tRNA ligase [Prevotellaceae bacterium]|jgi:cysteinyl-tRNA synthetase|nr:cysteine--tRNA ligase [Prevotellaceae bacterium]